MASLRGLQPMAISPIDRPVGSIGYIGPIDAIDAIDTIVVVLVDLMF